MSCVLKKLRSNDYSKYIMEDNLFSVKKFNNPAEAFKYLREIGENEKNYECVDFNTLISI